MLECDVDLGESRGRLLYAEMQSMDKESGKEDDYDNFHRIYNNDR